VISFMALYQIYWLVSIIWFYKLRQTSLRIRQRNFWLVFLQTVFVEWVLFFGPLRDATDPISWSCDAVLWLRLCFIPIIIIPINLRIFNHYVQYRLQKLIAEVKLSELIKKNDDGQSHAVSVGQDIERSNSSPTNKQATPVTISMLESKSRQLSFLFNAACTFLALVPFLVITGVVYRIYPQYGRGCTGCILGPVELLTNQLGGFALSPLAYIAIKELYNKPDPLGFFKEIFLTLNTSMLFSFTAILLLAFDEYIGISSTGVFNWEWIDFLGAR